MLPKSDFDKTECLESLLGIRTGCTVEKEYPFFVEDIEGVDVNKLAKIAKGSNPTGVDLAKQLVNSSAREILADIELLLNNGYSFKDVAGDLCSSCTLLPTYTANTGVMVRSMINSQYQGLHITKVTLLTNVTGSRTFVIDDGDTQEPFDVNLQANTLIPVKLNYRTDKTSVKLRFVDPTVGLGKISCKTTSDCGCGSSAKSGLPIAYTGLLAGNEVTSQYGFLVCASVSCSYDSLVCKMIKLTPGVFGSAMMLKFGEKYYLHKAASDRNNQAVSYNEEEPSELVRNYGNLYASRLYGKSDRRGIKNVINDYLKNFKDGCIQCHSKISTAYAVG